MAKYVRTKDGIYKGNEDWYRQCYCFEPIIKQADTIEELCDLIVIKYSVVYGDDLNEKVIKHETQPIHNDSLSYLQKNYPQKDGYTCYFAIWTDKGLVYVAKMNEKGELELL